MEHFQESCHCVFPWPPPHPHCSSKWEIKWWRNSNLIPLNQYWWGRFHWWWHLGRNKGTFLPHVGNVFKPSSYFAAGCPDLSCPNWLPSSVKNNIGAQRNLDLFTFGQCDMWPTWEDSLAHGVTLVGWGTATIYILWWRCRSGLISWVCHGHLQAFFGLSLSVNVLAVLLSCSVVILWCRALSCSSDGKLGHEPGLHHL